MTATPIERLGPAKKKSCRKVELAKKRITEQLADAHQKRQRSEYWHEEKHSFRPSGSLDKTREEQEKARSAAYMKKRDRRLRELRSRRQVVLKERATLDGTQGYDQVD